MKKIIFVILVSCIAFLAQAQRVYFIYLQSENSAPFFAKMSDKIHSSTSTGYLILSNLIDSTYAISIGFPGGETNESVFKITVDGKDKGLLIKNFEGNLGLFDLQTMNVYKRFVPESDNAQTTIKTDSFSRRLSQAAKDESLLTTVTKKELKTETKKEPPVEVKAEPVIQEEKEDVVSQPKSDTIIKKPTPLVDEVKQENPPVIVAAKPDTMVTQVIKEQPVLNTTKEPAEIKSEPVESYRKSVVKRKSESSTTEGFGLVFIDTDQDFTDTIRLLIPNPQTSYRQKLVEPVKDESVNVVSETERTNDIEVSGQEIVKQERSVIKTSSCRSVASENEFKKLRKNMAGENEDEGMIDEAKKIFRNKCFTTDHIRNLSTLFLTDASKYQFFDAAYNHVADNENFSALQSEIKDEYYLKRFKALVRQ